MKLNTLLEGEAMATQAYITPSILAWARERAQLSLDILSAKLSVNIEKVEMWEKGEAKPTFKQAQTVAKILQVPFGYLFLAQPPKESLPIPDLRTINDTTPSEISPTFKALLNDIDRKQQWYKEYILESGEESLPFIGQFSPNDSIETVVVHMRETLGWTSGFASSANVKEEYIRDISNKAEKVGILVMRNSILGNNTGKHLSVNEFRGFAISDTHAPVIFINTSDAKSAQIFTLAHELAHLWIGESGISAVDLHKQDNNEIEKFCNSIAAELLVPKLEVRAKWDSDKTAKANCQSFAEEFHVSVFVALRRVFDLGYILESDFYTLFSEAQSEFEEFKRRQQRSTGGDFYRTLKVRNSETFSHAVVSSALEGRILYKDASLLLNIKASKLNDYARKLGY